jgi:MFS family permease
VSSTPAGRLPAGLDLAKLTRPCWQRRRPSRTIRPLTLIYLIAAVAAPIVGPLLYRVLHNHPGAVRSVDGFVYVAVPGLLAWQVGHLALEQSTLPVLLAAAAGLAIPTLAEQLSHALHRHTDKLALLMGVSGLVLHALLEGAALAPGEQGVAFAFGLALVLHRIPVSLVMWWLIRPRYGLGAALLGIAAIVVATLVGFFLGTEVVEAAHGTGGDLYQAFVSGSLVHVVFHQGRHDHTHD